MKKLPVFLLLFVSFCANAQKYKDSLYAEYTRAYWEERMVELKYTTALFHVAENVFSVKNPGMKYAIKESKLSDSTAISLFGYEMMGCFLDDKFLDWAGDHFDTEMLPILEVYGEEICNNLTQRIQSYGKIKPEDMPKKLELAVQEGSVKAAQNPAFIKKTAELRAEHGQEMIMFSVKNTDQYLYVHCMFVRKYMMKSCVDLALAKYKEHQQAETQRMFDNFRSRIVNSRSMGNINSYFKAKTEGDKTKGYLRNIAKAAKDAKADSSTLKQFTTVKNNTLEVVYLYDNGKQEERKLLGTLQADIDWKVGQLSLSNVKYVEKGIISKPVGK